MTAIELIGVLVEAILILIDEKNQENRNKS